MRTVRILTLAALLALICASVWAQSPLLSVAELSRRADLVFVGDTTAATSHWNASRTMIFTSVRQRVVSMFKGNSVPEVAWEQPGGQVGNIKTTVYDGPVFAPGERSLLFLLAPSRMTIIPTVGGQLGKIRVIRYEQREAVELWRDGSELYPAPVSQRSQRVYLTIDELKSVLNRAEVR
jgi:hypothetical protein